MNELFVSPRLQLNTVHRIIAKSLPIHPGHERCYTEGQLIEMRMGLRNDL